ncbi:general substrate transporter, partial [Aspergillus ellipticus CBS 707.79]
MASASVPGKKPYFGLTGGWLTFWIMVACATDMTLFGYDQGVFSGVVVTDDFLDTLGLAGPGKTQVLSTVTAIDDVRCFFGAILAFLFGERWGRKKSIIVGTAIMSVGTLLQCTSYELAQMFVGRVILGVGNGINTTTAPLWQTETSAPEWRGKLAVFEMVMNIAGFCLVNWINYGLSTLRVHYRSFFGLRHVLTLARWLMQQGRDEEALEGIAAIE